MRLLVLPHDPIVRGRQTDVTDMGQTRIGISQIAGQARREVFVEEQRHTCGGIGRRSESVPMISHTTCDSSACSTGPLMPSPVVELLAALGTALDATSVRLPEFERTLRRARAAPQP